MQTIDISVVVPTRNERENIGPLIERLSASLPAQRSELIFVDDSTDDTPEVAVAAGQSSSLPVLVMHRGPGERVGGLGGAVVAGMRLAEGRIVVVMDGDLQHPPENDPRARFARSTMGEADLVVASRYRDNGGADGLANRSRAGVSRLATRLTKAAFPRRLQEHLRPDERVLRRPGLGGEPRLPSPGGVQDPARGHRPVPVDGRRRSAFRLLPATPGRARPVSVRVFASPTT